MSQEQQEQALQNSEPQAVDVTVTVGGDSRAERFLGTFDQISRLSLDIDRNYGNKRVLTDFPLKHDGSKWTGTINKLIVGFDYTITGHAYKCTDCPEVSPVYLSQNYSVTTFAGNGESGSSNGISSASSFNSPINLALDSNNNIFIADFGNKGIRKIDPSGNVTNFQITDHTFSLNIGYHNDDFTSWVTNVHAITVDSNNNIYFTENGDGKIYKVDPSGNLSFIAGSTSGFQDGIGNISQFDRPLGIAVNNTGEIFVSDYGNNRIRKIDSAGNVSTYAGNGGQGSTDGISSSASFNNPKGIALDSNGNLFVADSGNHLIRKIDTNGMVSTYAGNGSQGDNDGHRFEASFSSPDGVTVDDHNNVFVSDRSNKKIRIISSSGEVYTIAGSGDYGDLNGSGDNASFGFTANIILNENNDILLADEKNNVIRKISYTLSDSNDNHSYQEIFRGDTQHTVTEGTNTLNLRLAPLLDDRELTVPRITRINRPFQMEASTSDNITIKVDTVK